jgi:hypothetical protein
LAGVELAHRMLLLLSLLLSGTAVFKTGSDW